MNEYDAELQKHLTNEEFMQTRGKDYKKTSLVKSIQVFDEFIRKLEDANPSKIGQFVKDGRKISNCGKCLRVVIVYL